MHWHSFSQSWLQGGSARALLAHSAERGESGRSGRDVLVLISRNDLAVQHTRKQGTSPGSYAF